jgi:hypothetical protein
MYKIRNLLLMPVIISVIMLAGCYHNQNPVEPMHTSNPTVIPKLTIPAGAVVDSAFFFINVTAAAGEEVTLHGITNTWDESTVNWNNFGGAFNASSEGDFTPAAPGWYNVNVSSLVNSWLDSTFANNGILLKEEMPAQMQEYSSKEGGMSPYLKIFWTLNGSSGYDSTDAAADSYIFSGDGDVNYGDSTHLITGWQDTTEYQTLVKFEIEQTPMSGGCTRGYGYWKTHSKYGPAPYDSIWAMLGEDSTFFLSGQSFYQVLWTQPKHGNAYYILAHQYIAVDLNMLKGADPSDVQEDFNDATSLFELYTPGDIGALHGNDTLRQHFISLSGILGEYNSGVIGPGSCDTTTADARVHRK